MSQQGIKIESKNKNVFYDRLYRSLYGHMKDYGLSLCNSNEIVEDSLQELFEYFLKDDKRIEGIKDIKSYLKVSLKRSIFKKISHQNKLTDLDDVPAMLVAESAEYRLIEKETQSIKIKLIRRALNNLSEGESAVLKSKFFEDKSYDDIAKENNSTKRTVYNQVHSGIKKLRTLFK